MKDQRSTKLYDETNEANVQGIMGHKILLNKASDLSAVDRRRKLNAYAHFGATNGKILL